MTVRLFVPNVDVSTLRFKEHIQDLAGKAEKNRYWRKTNAIILKFLDASVRSSLGFK